MDLIIEGVVIELVRAKQDEDIFYAYFDEKFIFVEVLEVDPDQTQHPQYHHEKLHQQ